MTQPSPSYPPPGYPVTPGYPVQPGYPTPPAAPPQGGYAVPPQAGHPPGYRLVPAAPDGRPLPNFGERLVAYIVDSLIMGAVVLIPVFVGVFFLVQSYLSELQAAGPGGRVDLGPVIAIYLVVILGAIPLQVLVHYLYQVSYQVRTGQTVGKRIMKLKIVNLADGTPMAVTAARKRWLLGSVAAMVGPFAYIDGLWQLWDQPYRQCLHDKWAQTLVVKVAP